MSRVVGRLAWCAITPLLLASSSAQQQQFPQYRGQQFLSLEGMWEATPIIAVGDLQNVAAYGVQHVDHAPYPIMQDLHELYWCQAEFAAVAVVKGELATTRRYMFVSVNPGCRLFYGDRESYEKRTTRVWFLRQEADYLRPTFDGAAMPFYGFFGKWRSEANIAPSERLGMLLLTPGASTEVLSDFSRVIWDHADVACSLLGKKKCVEQIRRIAALGDKELRDIACRYLKVEEKESCDESH